MRTSRTLLLLMAALLVFCFGVAARLDMWFQGWAGNRAESTSPLGVLLGDSRRIFANHFFVKADAYFHSGYYPTAFDNREAFATPHMAEDAGAVRGKNQGDENSFLGKPRDWIDAFSRKFYPSFHTHLDEGGARAHSATVGGLGDNSDVREILPWLRISAELDPKSIQTYTVTAYWLRERMGKTREAEQFLRDGLRENPGSYEILYELGRVYAANHRDPARARNLWELALKNWEQSEQNKKEPDNFLLNQILSRLAFLEEDQGRYPEAITYLRTWKKTTPHPDQVEQRITEIQQKLNLNR